MHPTVQGKDRNGTPAGKEPAGVFSYHGKEYRDEEVTYPPFRRAGIRYPHRPGAFGRTGAAAAGNLGREPGGGRHRLKRRPPLRGAGGSLPPEGRLYDEAGGLPGRGEEQEFSGAGADLRPAFVPRPLHPHPHRPDYRPRRRRHRGYGGVCRRDGAAGGALCPGADHPARPGGLVGRRQGGGRPQTGKKPRRPLLPAETGADRPRHPRHPPRPGLLRRDGGGGQIRPHPQARPLAAFIGSLRPGGPPPLYGGDPLHLLRLQAGDRRA